MNYDFEIFLNSVKYLDKEDILNTAYKMHKSLDKSSPLVAKEVRLNLQNSISGLLFLLEQLKKPDFMNESEFLKLESLCKNLVNKNQIDKSILKIFEN